MATLKSVRERLNAAFGSYPGDGQRMRAIAAADARRVGAVVWPVLATAIAFVVVAFIVHPHGLLHYLVTLGGN